MGMVAYGVFYGVVWFDNNFLGGIYTERAYVVGAVIAVLFAIIFQLLNSLFGKIANKYFFFSLYNYQETINKLANELNYYTDLNKIINAIVDTIKTTMQLNRAGVLLINTSVAPTHYQIARVIGFNEQNGISLVQDNFLTRHLEKTKNPLVRDEVDVLAKEAKTKKDADGFRKLYNHMKHIEASLCLPLISGKKLIGIVVLGAKISGDAYTKEDLDLLSVLSSQAGTAIDNARLYEKINEFNETLQEKVDEQTKSLKAKNVHLKKLLKMRSEFLDIASHQLKTPVSVILGTISMFQEGSMDKLPKKRQLKFINNIFQKAKKLSSIINDILRASEMDTDEFKLNKINLQSVQVEEIIQAVYDDLKKSAEDKGLKLTISNLQSKVSSVMSDPDFLEQAIYNLVDNAIKYTKKGEVKIALTQEDNRVIIRVKDTGIGIPETDHKKIFDKFARARNAVNMYTDGSGLGVFIVKKIIEAHQGGQVSFESKEDEGTVFTISLPAVK